ncbi:MAG: antitoxin VapB family protein [Methanocellales archaeon]|nr:antitoxin VapB family protein [Methanocellales archaeon]
MVTTIQIKEDVKAALDRIKMFERETYNDVLERLLEDVRELDEETKKDIQKAIKEIESGKFKTHEQLETEMGF